MIWYILLGWLLLSIPAGFVVGAILRASNRLAEALSRPGEGLGMDPAVIARLGAAEAEIGTLRRGITDLETQVEARHRKLSGMISEGRRRDRGGQFELPTGDSNDELPPMSEAQKVELLGRLGVKLPDPGASPNSTGEHHTGRIRPLHRRA